MKSNCITVRSSLLSVHSGLHVKGIGTPELSQFVSKGEIYAWLQSASPKDVATQKLAQRLLNFKDFPEDIVVTQALKALANGKKIDSIDQISIQLANQFWTKQDFLFTGLSKLGGKQENSYEKLGQISKQLPNTKDFEQLDQAAYERGAATSANNQFQIVDHVWSRNLQKSLKNVKTL